MLSRQDHHQCVNPGGFYIIGFTHLMFLRKPRHKSPAGDTSGYDFRVAEKNSVMIWTCRGMLDTKRRVFTIKLLVTGMFGIIKTLQ